MEDIFVLPSMCRFFYAARRRLKSPQSFRKEERSRPMEFLTLNTGAQLPMIGFGT